MITIPPFDFLSDKDIKSYIHLYGKRAQSRLKTLDKAYSPGGRFYGQKSHVLDKYGGLSTATRGKSRKQLELILQTALSVLNAKTSTISGIKDMENKRLETFKKNHPGIKAKDSDSYKKAMGILGRIQDAEKGRGYDSDEQVALAYYLAGKSERAVDRYINRIINNKASSEAYFSKLSFKKQLDFMPISDDVPQEAGDQGLSSSGRKTSSHGSRKGSRKKK